MTALGEARWLDLAGRAVVLLQPVGACEQHGPHLPLSTDSRVAGAVAGLAAQRLHGQAVHAVCAPALEFGASGEHQDFPGTVSIGHEALRAVLLEIGRSACTWAARLVFVNGHGGNLPTVGAAVRQLRAEGREVGWYPCRTPDGAAHAGRDETSLMLAIAPQLVRPALARAGATAPLAELMPLLRTAGMRAVSASGVLGDPAGASAEQGHALLDRMAEELAGAVARGRVDDTGRLR